MFGKILDRIMKKHPRTGPVEEGELAAGFSHPGIDGKTYSLKEALAEGPVLAAFFKVSCPTCQFTFPFLERFHRHFGRVWGISQDDRAGSQAFVRECGLTFPILLDDTRSYPTSNAYGIEYVPSIFLIGTSGEILHTSVGFFKKDLEEVGRKLEALTGKKGFAPFHAGEDVPAQKAG